MRNYKECYCSRARAPRCRVSSLKIAHNAAGCDCFQHLWSASRAVRSLALGVALGAIVLLAITPVAAQTAYKAPRTADGKPNLNGIWQVLDTSVDWDIQGHAAQAGPVPALGASFSVPPGIGVVEGGTIPYLPGAAAKRKENFDKRLKEDPEIKCYMPGVPRATYMPYPFQIFQSAKYISIAYEFANSVRTIYMDDPGPAPNDSWMGWSVGHWEGDTLVVDVTSQNGHSWFDRAGDFASENLHVVERYTATGPDHLLYEATLEDPTIFTRPWKISFPLYRRKERNMELSELKCVEFVEDYLYGTLRKKTSR
jgi:hypothetical protein